MTDDSLILFIGNGDEQQLDETVVSRSCGNDVLLVLGFERTIVDVVERFDDRIRSERNDDESRTSRGKFEHVKC
jgi:hypothetical protein